MSLSASMWTSVSGLLAHGEKMNIVGNNISNVNTLAYKSQRMDFQDFVYQIIGTAGGSGQVGRGTNIGAIMSDFSQGSFESTGNATDLAIEGQGYFKVKPKNNNMEYYTRAGNFNFDKNGFLVNPNGYVLQGWTIDQEMQQSGRSDTGIVGSGSPTDVRLDTFTCPPKHTNSVVLPLNLAQAPTTDSTYDKSTDTTDPFFSLLKRWDATQTPPLSSGSYAHQATIDVYDEAGRLHKLTVYMDQVTDTNNQNIGSSGETYWEFVVTMDPGSDLRDYNSLYDPNGQNNNVPNVPDELKGLLGAGTMTFTSTGQLKDMSMFVPQADFGGQWWKESTNPVTTGERTLGDMTDKTNGVESKQNTSGATMYYNPADSTAAASSSDPGGWVAVPDGEYMTYTTKNVTTNDVDLTKWVAAPMTTDGRPVISPNFSGTPGLQNPYQSGSYDKPNPDADQRLISIDFGLSSNNGTWNFASTAPVDPVTGLVTASGIGQDRQYVNGMDGHAVRGATSTVSAGSSFYDLNGKKQDGYTSGDLQSYSVSTNGVLSASYSNGQSLQLYQLVLYDFPSNQNLRREGGNMYSATMESGEPSYGAPGTGSFGTTQGYSLEQSNADISREFVNMITTQRGFQANSKTITTVDTMLETVISMKR